MKRLVGDRIVLEPVTPENAATLWKIMQGPQLREFQDVPRFTRAEFERRVAARAPAFDVNATGRFEWLVMLRSGGTPMGWVSLRLGEHARGTAEIGYSLLVAHRGHGYARQAAELLVRYAFETSDLARVEACCVPENAASRRLLASVGFSEIKTQRNGAIVRGRPVDIVIFELGRGRARELYDESANEIVIPASANPK